MTVYDPQKQGEKNMDSGDSLRDQWRQYQSDQVLDAELAKEIGSIKKFQMGLQLQAPRLWVTPAIIAINVLVFVVMVVSGVSLMSPKFLQVLSWGGSHGLLTLNGDWWRLLTATIVHIGLIHLLFNMYALYILGPAVERLFQPFPYFVLYLLSGLGGSLTSVWWQPNVASAGASGAVFGVFGALLGFGIRQKSSLPETIFAQLRRNAMLILGINFVLGMSVKGIDMAGHVGGLVAGFALGWVMSQPVGIENTARRTMAGAVTLVAGLALCVGVYSVIPRGPVSNELQQMQLRLLISTASSQKSSNALDLFQRAARRFSKTEKSLLQEFDQARAKTATRGMSQTEFGQYLMKDQAPKWRKSLDIFATVPAKDLPASYRKRLSLMLRYIKARESHSYYLGKGMAQNDASMIEKSKQQLQIIQSTLEELNKKK